MVVTVGLITAVVGGFVTVGADARWLAALGRIIVSRGAIPRGVPFAAASTSHWHNTLVLAELIFHWLESAMGDRGLAVAELVAVAGSLAILARDARAAGARSIGIPGALAVAALGAFSTLAIARVQLFSLVMFPALVALLRAEHRRPSWRIWLALPWLALWSNLHGAALAGLAVLWAYLALSRSRQDPWQALGVGLGALVALCLTPAGIGTVDYYRGLLTNVAAERGVGLWAPLGHSPLDWVLAAAALLLAWRAWRARPPWWELLVALGLTLLTVKAARDGVWLIYFLVAPAARASRAKREWNGLLPVGAIVAVALLAVDIAQAPRPSGASRRMLARAIELAAGSPILADDLPAEQLVLDGGRIWAGNPLDAFSRRVQTEYVNWITGSRGGRAALDHGAVRIVLVLRKGDAARLTRRDPQFVRVAEDSTAVIYARRSR